MPNRKLQFLVFFAVLSCTTVIHAQKTDLEISAREAAATAAAAARAPAAGGAITNISCPGAKGIADVRNCRAFQFRTSSQWPTLLIVTDDLLNMQDARFWASWFFQQNVNACASEQPSLLPATWNFLAPKFATFPAQTVTEYLDKAPSFPAYKEELRNLLMFSAPLDTLELVRQLKSVPTSRPIVASFLLDSLSLRRDDCKQLSELEKKLIREIALQL